MVEADNLNDSLSYVSYDLQKDYTRTGSIKLTPTLMRLAILTYFDKMEHEATYIVTDELEIKKFYREIGCLTNENYLKVKAALKNRFHQPALVKEFIDKNKIKYQYTQTSRKRN